MERRREIHAERQEERRKLREEQRVRGVNLGSTYLPAKEDEYLEEDPEADYGERYEDDYDNGYDDGSADNHDSGYHDNYADGHAEHYDDSYDYGDSDSGSYGESYGTRGRAEHAASRPRPKRQTPDQADVFTGSISMPDEYRDEKPDVPAYSTNLPAGEVVPPEPEDDYDLEAAARKLTESGFGRFEEAGEVFTGGARKLDGPVKTDRAEKADTYEDVAPWDEPDTYTENPYTENSYTADPYAQQQAEMRNGQKMQQEQTKAVQAASAENATLNRVQKPAQGTGQELQTESAQQMWETVQEPQPEPVQRMQEPSPYMPEPAPEEYLPEPDVAYTVKTEQNTDFAIPEESKHVVTAGGKVIETDTEALQKKLESTKKAETAKREAEQADSEAALQQKIQEKEEQPKKPYIYPPLSLLKRGSRNPGGYSEQEYRETAVKLQQTLRNFGVGVTVTNISCGPSVTRYELHPEQGVKVSKIVGLADDIKLSLAAEDIRIEAPIPGKSAVGIEVPNKEKTSVFLRDLLESDTFQKHPSRLAFAVGKDIGGQVVVTDIAKMPHLLIAGATGSGKSVCINTIIMSIIYKADPEDVKLIMVDPKVVELSVYNGIPHLLIPVVTDPKKASGALNWAVAEMTDRYKKFAKYGVRDLKGYNAKIETIQDIDDADKPKKMPQIVIIVDELADLMMVAPGEVEDAICRLAQLARAAGIHLVIATQRPSVNVITGLIKANVPSRIAFSVSSGVDSRTIIDMNGAEKLLGKGDMLFYPAGFPKPQRVQGAFVSDSEVQQVVDFLTEQGLTAQYSPEVENSMNAAPSATSSGPSNSRDEYFEQAGRFIIEKEKASIGMLQRMFKIGFNRAARIMDQLAEAGVVGEEEGTKPRKVLMTMEEFDQII
nr:DNA translocase FtsK [Clostridium sp. OF09-36]